MIKSISSQKLHDDLTRRITGGDLQPGMAIPSENELSEQYSISRPTVRRILEKLCTRNLLEKRAGKGTFVRSLPTKEDAMTEKQFIIGTDHLDSAVFYYSQIFKGIFSSPFGKNASLNFQQGKDLEKGIATAPVNALLLSHDILPDAAYEKLLSQKIQILHLNRVCALPGVSSITVDHTAEAEKAVEYFLRYGHREIAMVGGRQSPYSSQLRMRGWENAYRKMGVPVPEHLRLSYDEIQIPGRAEEFIRGNRFSAVFCVNYATYQMFIQEFVRCTGKKSTDIDVFVFDDLSLALPEQAHLCNYIKMPLFKMGEMSIEYLRKKAFDPDCPVMKTVLPCSLIINR